MKKKKCRGNRKIQRYRRQLYAQGLDSEVVAKLVAKKLHLQQQQQEQQNHEETLEGYNVENMEVYIPLDRVCFDFFHVLIYKMHTIFFT